MSHFKLLSWYRPEKSEDAHGEPQKSRHSARTRTEFHALQFYCSIWEEERL